MNSFCYTLTIAFGLIATSVSAQCPAGSIALVKKNARDWPTTYWQLPKSFITPSLSRYFFTGNTRRECLTLVEIQQLSAEASRVLGNSTNAKARALLGDIQYIAEVNKPTQVAGITANAGTVSASVQTVKSRMPSGTDTLDQQADTTIDPALIDAAKTAEAELPSSKSPIGLLIGILALGALAGTLLGGALVYLRFYQRAKHEAADLRAENAALNQQIAESRRKSPPIAPVQPEPTQFPAPLPAQKAWSPNELSPAVLPDSESEIKVEIEPEMTFPLNETSPSIIPIRQPTIGNLDDVPYLHPPKLDGTDPV
jgi:hypothetical protein